MRACGEESLEQEKEPSLSHSLTLSWRGALHFCCVLQEKTRTKAKKKLACGAFHRVNALHVMYSNASACGIQTLRMSTLKVTKLRTKFQEGAQFCSRPLDEFSGFSTFNVHANHLGISIMRWFRFSRSGAKSELLRF